MKEEREEKEKGGGEEEEEKEKREKREKTFQICQRLTCFNHLAQHFRCPDDQTKEQKGHLPWRVGAQIKNTLSITRRPIQEIKKRRLGVNISLVMMIKKMMVNTHTLRPHPTCCRAEATPVGPHPLARHLWPQAAATTPTHPTPVPPPGLSPSLGLLLLCFQLPSTRCLDAHGKQKPRT